MKTLTIGFAAIIVFLLVGCASSGLSSRDPGAQHTAGILSDLAARATTQPSAMSQPLKRPAKLAVAQVGEIAPPQKMMSALNGSPEHFSSVQAVPAMVGMESWAERRYFKHDGDARAEYENATRRRIDSYRAFAQQIDADYLLLVGGTGDTLENTTPLSVLDLTIIGMFIIPSRTIRGEVKAIAVAIDVETGAPVMIQSAQANATALSPTVGAEGNRVRLLERLRDEAMEKIAVAMKSRT